MGKRINLFLCWVFCFIIILGLIHNVYALGVTPGKTNVNFKPGYSGVYSFKVINSEKKDATLAIVVQGDLKDYISVSEELFKMSSAEQEKSISYTVNLPDKLPYGNNVGEIVVVQLPDQFVSTGETSVGASLAVVTQVEVFVPYPNKYAETDLNVQISEDKNIRFIMPLRSRGELNIVRAKANVDIYDALDKKIASVVSNELPLNAGGVIELVAPWNAGDASPGRYRAVATIIYDEETATIEKEFTLGNRVLEIKNIEVNDFTLGQIAKFEILVENKWSEAIKGAYVQMQIYNKEGAVMADFKSQTYDVSSRESKLMTAFWDTDGVNKGTYDASVILKYGQESAQQDLKLEVSEHEINVVGLGYVISERGEGKSNGLVIILSVVIGILVLINLLWFLVLRKRFAKNKK